MGTKHNIDTEVFLKKILASDLNKEEKDHLVEYIRSSFKDEKLDELMNKHWGALDHNDLNKTSADLQHLKIQISSIIAKKQLLASSSKSKVISLKAYLVRIAAVLFIPLLICSAYLFYRLHNQSIFKQSQIGTQQVFASPGSRVNFTLPDQTKVWLNSASSLEFPINLSELKERKVKLTGQGYFEVSHDEDHPFFVETNGLNIKVLGTSFDVSGYDEDYVMSSTLEEGSIVLVDSKGEEISFLVPGQKATLNKETRKLLIEEVDTKLTTSWKDGYLIFKNTHLSEVIKKLERWYNCNIDISEDLLNSDIQYNATIQDETLGEVLQMIELTTSVKTKIENREVTIW